MSGKRWLWWLVALLVLEIALLALLDARGLLDSTPPVEGFE